jgi:hypothetical protein
MAQDRFRKLHAYLERCSGQLVLTLHLHGLDDDQVHAVTLIAIDGWTSS